MQQHLHSSRTIQPHFGSIVVTLPHFCTHYPEILLKGRALAPESENKGLRFVALVVAFEAWLRINLTQPPDLCSLFTCVFAC